MPIVSPNTDDKVNLHQLSILKHGVCTVCGKPLVECTKVYSGKKKSGEYAIACEGCKDKIETRVTENVYYHQEAVISACDTKLWRYQDFSKFVSLLDSGKLFFTRADSFDDPFECARGFNFQKDAVYYCQEC